MADDIVERLRGLLVRADPNGDDPCEHCGGYGEWFGHAPGCDNDSCALAGGIDDCDGAVEPCQCRIALEQEAVEALPALLAEITRLRTLLAEEREACAALIERGEFDSSVRLDPKKHKNLSDWFREQQAAAIRARTPPQSIRERG